MWVFIVAFFPVNVLQRTRCAACECVHAADKNAFFSPQPLFANFRFFHSRHFPAPGKKVCYVFKIRWANVKFFLFTWTLEYQNDAFFSRHWKRCLFTEWKQSIFRSCCFFSKKKKHCDGKKSRAKLQGKPMVNIIFVAQKFSCYYIREFFA